jgi:UDP-glucose:(heptosyl)LPS alpha-1,3-glucosyltransferase
VKIALVIEKFDASCGGREASTVQIAAGLVGRGHHVTALCQQGVPGQDGAKVIALGRRGLGRSSRLRKFVADVQRAIADRRFDVVHATLPIPGANVYQLRSGTTPAQAEASLRRRWFLERFIVRATRPLRPFNRLMADLERQVVQDPNVTCLPVSGMIADELSRFYGRTTNVRVIFNGVDSPAPDDPRRDEWRQRLRFQLGLTQQDPVFLTIAANFPLKGVAETIRHFARWYHARPGRGNPMLIVVGRDNPEGYQRHAGLRDVGAHVAFIPPTREIFQWYAAADACVLLSWYDACSRVVLEATRWGIPSLTTAFNGAAEVLRDGGGIIVPSPNDGPAVVAGLEELADPDRRAERAKACRRVADRLSMDRHVEELIESYREVAGRA